MSLFYKGFFANQNLSFAGEFTGALYGMAVQVASAINEIRPTDIIVCKDTKPYLRSKDLPTYKSNRPRPDENEPTAKLISRSLIVCDKFLELAGLPVMEREGLEADDLIGALVRLRIRSYDEVVAITNDSDLYQLFVYPSFSIYRGLEKGIYSRKDFIEDYVIDPQFWVSVIALTGGHNSLPKIPGIGQVTAIKILSDESFRDKKRQVLEQHSEQSLLNEKLAKVPYYRFRDWWRLEASSPPRYNERKLIQFLQRYGIRFTSAMQSAFERLHGVRV